MIARNGSVRVAMFARAGGEGDGGAEQGKVR